MIEGRIVGMRVVLGAALILVAARSVGLAQGPALADADAAYEAGDLYRALGLYEESLEQGGLDRAALARVHLRLGVLYATDDAGDRARSSFELALALDPDMEAPPELGPAQRPLFDGPHAARSAGGIEVDARPEGPVDATGARLVVSLRGAPEDAVNRLRATSGEVRAEARAGEGIAIGPEAWATSRVATIRIDALDAHGNVLATTELELARLSPVAPPAEAVSLEAPPPAATDEGGDDVVIAVVLSLVAAAVIAGGVTLALLLTATDRYYAAPPVFQD